MRARIVAACLAACLTGSPAFAGPLSTAVTREAKRLATQAAVQTPSRGNPYKKPAIGLLAGGAALLVAGLVQNRGAEVSSNAIGTSVSVNETGGSKTALEVLGVCAMGGGAGLWFWGENKQTHPEAVFGLGGLKLQMRVGF